MTVVKKMTLRERPVRRHPPIPGGLQYGLRICAMDCIDGVGFLLLDRC